MPAERNEGHRLMTLLGRALSRDAAYYTLGMASVFPLGIASALVTTAYLEPPEYGRLGLLMIFASLATIVYGLGVIQGTLLWAYGVAGDDGDDDGAEEDLGGDDQPVIQRREHRRRIMGSGLLLASFVALAGTTVLVLNAGTIANLIGGSVPLHDAVVWACISAGLGSLWRLALQVYRLERRAAMFLVVSVSRPLFTLILTIVLLSGGHGLPGAVAAVALGTAASLVVGFGGALANYSVRFRPADFKEIIRRGRAYALIIITVWLVTNADLWVLSRFATDEDVGLYRLASRFGVFPSYVTSAYLLAWLPLQRSAVFQAAVRARTRQMVSSTMFTYYCIGAMGLLILLTVGSELFIGLAPSSYADAAPYVPAVGGAVTAHGSMYVLYRIGKFKYRRPLYVAMLTLAATVLTFLGAVLAGPMGGYGVALAGIIGSLLGSTGFVIAIRRAKRPIPFQWPRIAVAVALGTALVLLVSASPLTGVARVIQDLLVLVLYPVAIVLTGVVPRPVVRDVIAIVRATIPLRPGGRRLARRVAELPESRREAIGRWVGQVRTSDPTLAFEPDEEASLTELARGLRAVAGTGDDTELDAEIGAYLTHRGSHIDHDLLAEELVERGADALDLHLLDDAYKTLRQRRRRLSPRRPAVKAGVSQS